ncbi:Iq-domain 32, putative isoform 3 [Hibiscus syriacus]|uniref:Iq-domain 32, putative isoform 3 n=1 Tax=Hibiscus syriacus TaxID=106335 RepID=A0A6A3CKJ1_HIBSY|nr:Iq-domain 32, putative isoform 3 [Hibiscus syriacus]
MGRSASCFKIITCGSDSVEDDDAIDNKRSGDKKGWSFRKRSERHRVLSNTVTQEASSGLKESPESASYAQQSDVSIAPEKTSTVQYTEETPQLPTPKECVEEKSQLVAPKESVEEKSQLLTAEDLKVYDPVVATTDEAKDDASMDDSVIIVIQTAIRGFLAQKEIGKLKNLVKLQAAVRGHLVRRHAVGTLRVQAIVKMQLLVRARRSHLSQEGSYTEKKMDSKDDKDNQRKLGNNKNASSTSIEKLLSNRFARQLMDSTPKTKPIRISCDPSKPSSAWSWLERWMSASSSGKVSITELPIEQPGKEKSDNFDTPLDSKVSSEAISKSNDPKFDVSKTLVSSGCEENLITYDAANSELEACRQTSPSVTGDLEQSQIYTMSTSDVKGTLLDQTMQTDAHSQTEASFLSNKPEIESEEPISSIKRVASEQLETEAKKFVSGSRKASSPAFIAAKTKFSELSSTDNTSRSIDSYREDVGVDSNLNTVTSGADTVSRSRSQASQKIQSEVGTIEYENGAKVSEQNCRSNSAKDLDVKDNDRIGIQVPGSSLSRKKLDDTKGESANLVVLDSPQLEQEPTSNLLRGQDSEKVNQACRSSPEASPRSHMTVPDSQGTPSSQVSVKLKRRKLTKHSKAQSLSAARGSPSTATRDSDASSMEQSSKYQRSGKRRNSFGSTRHENVDEEPRDSNSSNSLPRFMQATESARAKLMQITLQDQVRMCKTEIFISKRDIPYLVLVESSFSKNPAIIVSSTAGCKNKWN